MAGAGHVAVGGPSDRQAVRGHQPASAAMAHARQGLGHRPFGPGQIMPGLKTAVFASLRPPPARAWLVTCSNDNQTVGDKMSRTF